ncbi:MAG: type B 50S ribosomal protein L31 [Opitutales bacterium]|nr:type B 50S ribosomal protein L31 [Opitutales bacterium]
MKKNIHPKLNKVCFVDVSTGKKFPTRSVLASDRKEVIDGEEHFMILRDITMDSHPVYTGEKRFVDTAGRVDKFNKKFSRRR